MLVIQNMTLKSYHKPEKVWFESNEHSDLMEFIRHDLKPEFAPNQIIRLLAMMALNDNHIRDRVTQKLNLEFEQDKEHIATAKSRGLRACCDNCEFKAWPGSSELNRHRNDCKHYQKAVSERIAKLIQERTNEVSPTMKAV